MDKKKVEKELDKFVERQIREIEREEGLIDNDLDLILKRYLRLVKASLKEFEEEKKDKPIGAFEVNRINKKLEEDLKLLDLDGYREKFVKQVEGIIEGAYNESSKLLGNDKRLEVESIRRNIEEVGDLVIVDLQTKLESIKTNIILGGISKAPRQDIFSEIINGLEQEKLNSQRMKQKEVVQNAQRIAIIKSARKGANQFYFYKGPRDNRNSPQCRHILDTNKYGKSGVYQKKDISINMHPNLKRDPFYYGGHPNCRHLFVPISFSQVKELEVEE
jgi:hypothetical protein